MALNAQIARNTQPSNPAKNRGRPMARHQKTNQSTIQHVCLSSQDPEKKTSTQIGLATSKKNTSTAPMDIIEVEPDDNKTMMTTSRMGADMRSIHKRQHCTATTVLHQRDESKRSSAGRQQSRSARSPQDAKKAVQQREPDLHHHRTLTETTTRTQNRLGTKTLVPPIVTRTQ